jgi:hypothetical protein
MHLRRVLMTDIRRSFAWLVMTLLAFAVAAYAITVLFAPALRPGFVAKIIAERPAAAFAHLLGGSLALVAGAFQFNFWLRSRFIAVHRWLGRLYVLAVAVGGVASFALALYAFGGAVAQVGFALLAVCWMGSTLNGYRNIRQSSQSAHRIWMIRSYALTLAAVTLRVYIPLSQLAGISITVAYPAIAWLCWVPNLLVAEWFLRRRAHT